VVSYDERPRHQQHEPRENVAEALLCGDAEHHPGYARTHKGVRLHLEHREHGEHNEQVTDDSRKDPYRSSGPRRGSSLDEAAQDRSDPVCGDEARDEQHDRAGPGDDPQVKRRPVSDAAELGPRY
jgi:hypothetical protein